MFTERAAKTKFVATIPRVVEIGVRIPAARGGGLHVR